MLGKNDYWQLWLALLLAGYCSVAAAQSTPVQPAAPPYPRVAGYFSIVHPMLTVVDGEVTPNFNGAYSVGFPTGVNILKSDRIGFSFELTPFIRAERGSVRMSNLLFHPGVMFRFPHYFTINARLAFETSGRFGITPVFSKVVRRMTNSSYFIAVPLPVRLGNDVPVSVGAGVQVGVSF